MTAQEVCDSKQKLTKLAAEYLLNNTSKGYSQSYYTCPVCKELHIYTINKKLQAKRKSKLFYKDTAEIYRAKQHLKKRPRRKK